MKPHYVPIGAGLVRATPASIKAVLKDRCVQQADIGKTLLVSNTYVWSVLHGHVRSARIEEEISRLIGAPIVLDLNKKTQGALALLKLEEQLKKEGKTLLDWAAANGFTREHLSWLRTGRSLATCGNAKRLCLMLGLPTGKRNRAKKPKAQS